MQSGSIGAYVHNAISNQDFFAETITFPENKDAVLTTKDYENYFSLLNAALSDRKRLCDVLCLTQGNEALPGLLAYLKTNTAIGIKTLALNITQPLDESFFEILRQLSAKGLSSIKLVNAIVDNHYLDQLLASIITHKLAIDIELPVGNEQTQQKIDELVSIYKREKRIASYHQKGKSGKAEVKGNSKAAKRKRPPITVQIIGMDVEAEVEVAIERSVEAAVEEQMEDKDDKEFINRDEFISRAKGKGFKLDESHYAYLQWHETRTWDHWLGNINQWVIGSKKIKKRVIAPVALKCGLLIRSSAPLSNDDTAFIVKNYDCAFVLIQSKPGEPVTEVYFIEKNGRIQQGNFHNNPITRTLPYFLRLFYPRVTNNNFHEIPKLSHEQISEASSTASIQTYDLLYRKKSILVEDEEEQWKGKKIHDASAHSEDEKSIEALKDRCEIKFKNPELSSRLFENPNLSMLTTAACEKLLQHQAQLQYGLDFQRLPAGFEVIETNVGGKFIKALDYSARQARIQRKDPLAIRFSKRPEASPLSQDLFSIWLQNAKFSALEKHYQDLLQKPYNRHSVDQFKKYLPILLQMSEELLPKVGTGLEALIKAAQHYQTNLRRTPANLEKHLLFLLINDKPELCNALKGWQKKLKLTSADLNGFLTVYDAYGEKGLSDLFASWQNTEPTILQQLHQQYFVHCASYQPFLEEQYEEAINILNRFSKEERAWWNALFEQHCSAVGYDNLLPLVKAFQTFVEKAHTKNLKFNEGCHFKGIKSLPVALSRMLAIINKTSPADLELVWQEITKLDLQSNGAIRVINDSKSTLGTGQLVLPAMRLQPEFYFEDHDYSFYTKPREKPRHGYHALQITHPDPHRSKTYRELYVQSTEFTPTLNELSYNLHGLISFSSTQEELERNYYRLLAAQNNRLSLDFYQKAAKIIDTEVADGVYSNSYLRKGLYGLVAAATSGFEASLLLNDESHSLQDITETCRSLLNITYPAGYPIPDAWTHEALLKEFFTRTIHSITPPPLPYLRKMMSIMQKGFTFGILNIFTPDTLEKRFEQVEECLHTILSISEKHKYAFFDGIHFINEEKLSHKGVFKFAQLAKKLKRLGNHSNDNDDYYNAPINYLIKQKIRSGLISLMSTFQLTEDVTVKNLNPIISTDESQARLMDLLGSALKLLGRMKTNVSPLTAKQLVEDDLTQFINHLQIKLKEADPACDTDQLAVQLVKEKFAAYFDDDFFNSLHTTTLSAIIEDKIRQGFDSLNEQNWVKSILLSFNSVDDQFHRMTTVNSLIRIANRLPAADRTPFLKTLTTLNTKQDCTLEQLNDLLAEVGNRNTINDLIFLQDFIKGEPTTAVISKMITYYRKVLPFALGDKPKIISILDIQPLATRLLFNFNDDPNKFRDFLEEAMGKVYALVTEYPNEKQGILDLVNSFISEIKQSPSGEGFALSVSDFVQSLHALIKLQDPALIRSLSDHYRKKPLELRALMGAIQNFDLHQQHFILSMISVLLNNGRKCSPAAIQAFLGFCKAKPELLKLARRFFHSPPYPTFEQMISWHNIHQTAADYENAMLASYQAFNLHPCAREPENGFNLEEAQKYALQFKGMHFEEEELKALAREAKAVTAEEAGVLQAELKTFAGLSAEERQQSNPRLLAILAELLYRSKGADGGEGKSYEINTVQYLAVLSLLKSNGHITSEIATGEGKSRIMMLAIACQYVLGKTVDFVTSDMQLAQRDYLEYQAFFKMLGAETRLILATSAADVYRIKGINFSDASNLSLFRNKARSNGEGHKVIDLDPHSRALLLDEADRTYFDISETRFNYSQEANENIKNMEWIYPMLILFFKSRDPKILELYQEDMDACNKAFNDFIKAQAEYPEEITEEMLARYQALPLGQKESWQDAAITALDLQLGKDYAIEPNVLIETAKGPKLASEARLIYGHRLSRNSKFSFGVHQCLHALLNIELKDPHSPVSRKCAELNKPSKATVTHPFFIHPEKQIVYSTTSKSFLDEYQQGYLGAVSGTGGAIIEREEAAALFGKDNNESHAMEFVTVPRKKELQRIDKLLRLTGNFDQRVAAILEYIVEARKAGRPVLLICENDQEAEKIRDALKALALKLPAAEQIPDNQWQYVDSTTSSEKEKADIKRAGKPKMVTISTSRLARGTDIKTKVPGGLRVLGSYLPRERDLWQMFGRGGRYGAPGDARLIVDKEQLCRQLGKKKLDPHFFFANEFFVKNQQSRFDKEKQVERLIRNALSDFRIKITNTFFNYFDQLKNKGVPAKERQEKLMLWSDFTKKVDQLWNQAWPDLAHLVSQPVIRMHQVKRRLAEFKAAAQAEWLELHGKLNADKQLPLEIDKLVLDQRTEHLVRLMMPKRKYTMADRTLVYKTYDKALDGRAAVYDELFADWKASWRGQRKWFANTRAWWQGHGILFADTRAWWAGKRLLFATLRAWWNKGSKAVAAVKLTCTDLMDVLQKHKVEELKPFVCELDATKFLAPQKGDLLLSFRIQLVEAVLDFAHDRIEKGKTISQKDMNDMHNMLAVVKDTQVSQQKKFVDAVSDKLAHTTVRFFGRSLQKDLNPLIKQREQEQQEDEQHLAAAAA